ncbi:blue light receptor [Pichia californica]|uniref:Blue light receptor n=1 Tax=Pichia californica TaxID=460514 RepID=A0A9P7BEV1_9ASCO|nr:blue light receptor [[Candida] californica]KAG0687455.1 blue light receptor [[Candida] californica]
MSHITSSNKSNKLHSTSPPLIIKEEITEDLSTVKSATNHNGNNNNISTNIFSKEDSNLVMNSNSNVSSLSKNMTPTTSTISKEPKTPSLSKPATFSSPANINNTTNSVLLPETPERVPRHLNDLEDTPLLSPPSTLFSTSHTPQRQRNNNNTDFYTLLKSPARSQNDNKLKRRSMELFGITNAYKSPEQLHKEYDNDHLLKSPKRDYKEIRKISENLRTRLNYANIKVQHGWSNKSIGELEHSLEEIATNPQRSAQLNNNKNLEDFWNLRTDNLPSKSDINTEVNSNNNSNNNSGSSLLASPGFSNYASPNRRRKSFVSNLRLDDVAKRNSKTSPELQSNSEFLSTHSTGHGLQGSPIKKFGTTLNNIAQSSANTIANNTNNNNNNNNNNDNNNNNNNNKFNNNISFENNKTKLHVTTNTSDTLEQDAIMSLISLSSPVKYNGSGSLSPSPPRHTSISGGSPTRSNHSRLPSLNGISNKRLPPLPPTIQPPFSAPGIMTSSSDNSILAFDRSKDSRYILPSPPNFENRANGLGMINIGNRNFINPSSQHDINDHKYFIQKHVDQIKSADADETDDETTEDEIVDNDGDNDNDDTLIVENNIRKVSPIAIDRGIQHPGHQRSDSLGNNNSTVSGIGNKNNDIFRTTKFDGVRMTSKKGK